MGNVDEIAAWLKAKYIVTEWRPVTLKEGVLLHDEIQFKDGDARKIERETTSNDAVNLALNTVKTGGQALVFASTRKNAVSAAKTVASHMDKALVPKAAPNWSSAPRTANAVLSRKPKNSECRRKNPLSEDLAELVRCGVAFHHAGLAGAHRKIIEDPFKERKSKC